LAENFKYRAFISYSHADSRLAKRVHERLENFHIDKELIGRETSIGPIPETLRPIFRDRHDFDAGASLAQQTLAVLDSSAALIVLASPRAARSQFVNEELRQFKSRYPDRAVIPLIIDGSPGDPSKECFPPALRFSVAADGTITNNPVDLLAADLREEGDGIELATAKVVARLIGIAPDDVYRRAERELRRRARRMRWVQGLIYTLMAAVILGLIGWINQDYLKEQLTWYLVMRPYMVVNVRPYVLPAATESALVPGATFRECAKDCPEMVVIPPGQFTMGSPPTESGRQDNESPQHQVTIARPFAVSKFDVTFADWDGCVSAGGCAKVDDQGWGQGRQPVINVGWDEAENYVAWFSKMTGKSYRLLSEAEWEYAARAGTTTVHYWGDQINNDAANANCNGCGSQWDLQKASPVGLFKPNAFGLYDMEGNVWQWVQDCYHADYNGAPSDGSAWPDEDCSGLHVTRGGAYNRAPRPIRIAVRVRHATGSKIGNIGFRIARTLGVNTSASITEKQ
jgi:formylglycine-generating enzyme required for sulfatase activity